MDLEQILGNGNAKRQLERLERDDPNIRGILADIYQKYKNICGAENSQKDSCLEKNAKEVIELFEKKRCIYHAVYRVKKPESLIKKIVDRKYRGRKQYAHIEADNYHKIVTDLIGIKFIHRFPDEWAEINDWIYKLFYKGDQFFVDNYEQEYRNDCEEGFLIEPPVIYHLPEEDLSLYQEAEEKIDHFKFRYEAKENYRSVHYLINFKGIYVELQVRTLSDELWSEIEHDMVYKQEISSLRDTLSEASGLLRIILRSVDEISMYMKQEIAQNREAAEKYWNRGRERLQEAAKLVSKKGEDYAR